MRELVVATLGPALPAAYRGMLEHIETAMPAVERDSANFHKSHSQFMGLLLDVTAITPIRRIKHILAEIDRTRRALEEAHIAQRKSDLDRRRLEKRLAETTDPLDREQIEVELQEVGFKRGNVTKSMSGAVRKLSFWVTQHQAVLAFIGKDRIAEADYEAEEDRYHIMTAMKQALCAARSHGGVIDEGNHIYLFDLGINGAQAQAEVFAYLKAEAALLGDGKAPTHEATMRWLEACADKFAACAARNAKDRGYVLTDARSLHVCADRRAQARGYGGDTSLAMRQAE